MISTLLIWLTSLVKLLLQSDLKHGAKWFVNLFNLFALRQYRRAHPKSRQDLSDIWNTENIAKIGLVALPAEIEYANPKMVCNLIMYLILYKNKNSIFEFSFFELRKKL